MDYQDYCRLTGDQVDRFVSLISAADWATPVATCPGWNLAKLVGHVGAVQRWATETVRTSAAERPRMRRFTDTIPSDVDALPGWLAQGAEQLLDVLRTASPDQPVWAWGPDQHVRFWPRRMLHEVAVHRLDAALALAAGDVTAALAAEDTGTTRTIADDGIGEFLTNVPSAQWVPGASAVNGDGRTLDLAASDTGATWRIALQETGYTWQRREAGAAEPAYEADATATAPVVELYLFMYGRVPPRAVAGDAELLSRWTAATPL